jgi:small conductance mechanosensitive channel
MRELLRYFQELDAEVRAASITALRIALILALAWALQALAARLIRLFRRYMQRKSPSLDEQARIETLARVFRNGAAVIIVLVAGMLVLGELGISIAPILATAGVAGVALGFGAQSLIKDYFNGFFLLLDDQIREGDVVEVAGKSGLVEEVTLRYVRLRDFDGHVHFVPNGEIKVVSNRTRSFAYAAVDVGVGYGVDIDQALALMREAGQAMRADAKWQARLADDIEILGVERLDNSAVVLRCRLKVVPAIEQWNVKREFLKRVKLAFDARGIEMPFPQLTVHVAKDAGRP